MEVVAEIENKANMDKEGDENTDKFLPRITS